MSREFISNVHRVRAIQWMGDTVSAGSVLEFIMEVGAPGGRIRMDRATLESQGLRVTTVRGEEWMKPLDYLVCVSSTGLVMRLRPVEFFYLFGPYDLERVWSSFGTHVDQPGVRLLFSEELGEDGLPLWETPVERPVERQITRIEITNGLGEVVAEYEQDDTPCPLCGRTASEHDLGVFCR